CQQDYSYSPDSF
nr:immunoglobulin light chain junction region [Macaca mulatta]MOX89669.1 immunoglobulin light chain junction region [Macaca mulatta]MOX90197.1 immunoglobulin light chain junction region [Macaca mulatta]MOX90267.1 immunoglobulin light chain junction region [Macaca mulatta]MOX90272.1 immunoglobulin light chain junction region [Macaca mulatta]